MPNLIKKNLRGSILYHDGQFDDSRLGINLVQTIIEKGGTALNYVKVQYNNILKLRAIENNLPIVKCSSFGNSVFINQKGVITGNSKNKEFYTFNTQ
jgi:glycerol-3-phosphate dehydrogenase